MAHGSFSLNAVRAVDEEVESDTLHALALGNLTDRPLTGSATWLGIMVGTPTAGDDRGDRLVGTAALNYGMAAGGSMRRSAGSGTSTAGWPMASRR